ncbi:MBL fold metallo-hydrolase [Laceyella putida]|uniref:MBL fold metallo-hydrolase n=1 Tax=Laceyella putida TaxID=110101 RepID=A0ABW2RF97_9BACL
MNQWEDIYQISLPLPFALRMINAYVIKGSTGITLIDAGLNIEMDVRAWQEAQAAGGWQWAEVEKIVLTHYHPDHYGLAGTLQQWTGAPVYLSRTDHEQAQMFFGRDSQMPEEMMSFFARHGLPDEWATQIPDHMRSFHPWVEPHPKASWLEPGDWIRLGDVDYEVLHTPGHADGHLSFYDPKRKWLIGGDFLLPKITPNISLWPNCHPNPLDNYLVTLERMKEREVTKVFPSHGPMFDHYNERIEALERHHAQRLNEMRSFVVDKRRATAFEVCEHQFGTDHTIHNLRFALSETLAHLEYLRLRGELSVEERNGMVYYKEI